MQIAMRELKAGLSRYVAQARAGVVIEITSHDKPVARLIGIPATDKLGVTRLLARGAARWSGGKPVLGPAVKLRAGGKSLSEIVLEDRG
jgi:prevent-host-death family protein